ncbi:MAG: aminotransferase class V-fold PLP-dependent enzyme [Verrucomicrobiota bacterium]
MTIEQLHNDETLRNREFPVTAQKVFLGHAGVCPLPRCVEQGIAEYAKECTTNDQEFVLPDRWMLETRQLTAEFLGVQKEEVAFVGPTSLALSFVASGLKFRRTDNVLIYHDDYPSNVYPWMNLAERGVEVRFINIRDYGAIRPRDVIGQVDENTRLVALASCHFIAGYRIDIDAIGSFLRSRGILFCLDGIQTVGAFPTPLEHVDFMAADAHKWLLGPCGAGVFYVRKEVQDQLQPVAQGWHNLRCPDYVAMDDLTYKPDARRYEAGSHNLLGLAAIRSSIELLSKIGVRNIATETLRKRSWFIPELTRRGWNVLHGNLPAESAGPMFSFDRPGEDMAKVHSLLEANGIVASLRTNRERRRFTRLSPHFYNTDRELEKVLDLLPS